MRVRAMDNPRRDLGWTPYAWLIYLLFYLASPVVNGGGLREWAWTARRGGGVSAAVLLGAFAREGATRRS